MPMSYNNDNRVSHGASGGELTTHPSGCHQAGHEGSKTTTASFRIYSITDDNLKLLSDNSIIEISDIYIISLYLNGFISSEDDIKEYKKALRRLSYILYSKNVFDSNAFEIRKIINNGYSYQSIQALYDTITFYITHTHHQLMNISTINSINSANTISSIASLIQTNNTIDLKVLNILKTIKTFGLELTYFFKYVN